MSRKVAAVFGGSGFIGRHVVRHLAAEGYTVRIPVRDPEAARFLMTAGAVGQIVPLYADLAEPETIARGVESAALVVNLVGILAETHHGDFQRIQTDGAALIARQAAAVGAARFVHVSAIGANPQSASRYGRTKAFGEQAVIEAFPTATILRPSIVFGPEDQFFNRFAAMAQFSPVMPLIAGATRFQPVYVGDVAAAIHHALTTDAPLPGIYELGGPSIASFRELMGFIMKTIHRHRPLLPIPNRIAALQAAIMEHLPGKPFTRDQFLMLNTDNIVAPGARTLADLGITPTSYDLIVPTYLARYRPGGGASGA